MYGTKKKFTTGITEMNLERLSSMSKELSRSKAEILEVCIDHYFRKRFPKVKKDYLERARRIWSSKISDCLPKSSK